MHEIFSIVGLIETEKDYVFNIHSFVTLQTNICVSLKD